MSEPPADPPHDEPPHDEPREERRASPPPPTPDRPAGQAPRAAGRVRDPGSPRIALVCWLGVVAALAGMFALAYMAAPTQAEARAQAAQHVPPPSPMLEASAKLAVASRTQQEREQVLSMLAWFTQNPADRARVALVVADQGSLEDGLERLDRLAEKAEGELGEDVDAMRAVLREGPDAISRSEREGLVERHGYAMRLALTTRLEPDDPARAPLADEAWRSYVVQLVFSLALIGLGLLSIVLAITAVIMLATRSLKRAYTPAAPGGSAFLEAFLVFLVALPLSELLMMALEPAIGPYALLSRWVLILPALWPVLRGAPGRNTRYALGWHTGRGVAREMLAGAAGYLAMLPIVAVGLALTLAFVFIASTMAPPDAEGAPIPVHPLGDMLGQAGLAELIVLVQLAVLWAPIVEETFFRGALYHHLRARLNPIASGLLVGLLFAALHPQGLLAIPALASIGLVFSLLREWRGSLIGPMTAHALNNGFITLMVILLVSV